jgi:hypothetical protein
LHGHILLLIDDFEKFDLDELLSLVGDLTPEVGVSYGAEVGKVKSELRSREVSEFGLVFAYIILIVLSKMATKADTSSLGRSLLRFTRVASASFRVFSSVPCRMLVIRVAS